MSGGLRLLVVDDHEDTAELLAGLLEMRGHEVKTAATVGAALRMMMMEPFDILLSDVGLPDASGYDLVRTLRDQRSDVKAIAMSGWGRPEDIAQSQAAGFVEHLTKPVLLKNLELAIERARSA